jgi:hypothetical protein
MINLDKCHLVPSQIITYLGAVFNLNKGLVLPSENRFLAIIDIMIDQFLRPLTCHLMSAQVCTPTPLGCICPQNFVVWISLQRYPSENIPLSIG